MSKYNLVGGVLENAKHLIGLTIPQALEEAKKIVDNIKKRDKTLKNGKEKKKSNITKKKSKTKTKIIQKGNGRKIKNKFKTRKRKSIGFFKSVRNLFLLKN
jgi:hypothetical protein